MSRIFIIAIFLFTASDVDAQFTMLGKIEYERKMNLQHQFDDWEDGGSYMETLKAQLPKSVTHYFEMYFTPDKSLYKPGKAVEENKMLAMMGGIPGIENRVYSDYRSKKVTAYKKVYEQNFLLQDSMRKISWKITDEIRTIANYKCRKAVGRIYDSVVVVAFYTDDIPTSGGPELFSGLPGMILEIAIPRLYTTWIATSVSLITPALTDITPPEKGKKTTYSDLDKTMHITVKDWGNFANKIIWWAEL